MVLNKQTVDDKLSLVGAKIQSMKKRLIIPGQRDEECFAVHTTGRIIQAAKNALFSGEYFDPVQTLFSKCLEMEGAEENFAAAGYSSVAELPSRTAEDITIITAITSMLPYLGIERTLTSPEDSISYQDLVDKKTGEILVGSYRPSNIDLDLSMKTVEQNVAAAGPLSFGGAIVPGAVRVAVKYTDATGEEKEVIGRDTGKNGIISWAFEEAAAQTAVAGLLFQINYETGVITVVGTIPTGSTVKIAATLDTTVDSAGENRLRAVPKFHTDMLVAHPKSIDLESNLAMEAYRNKMIANSIEAGLSVNVAETSFRQLMQVYIAYVNILLTSSVISAGEQSKLDQPNGNYIEKDISSYALATSFVDTKNDMLDEFILDLNTQLMLNCGSGATCLLVGTIGATKLGNVKNSFVAAPTFVADIDGYIGTYMNIPVVRHRLVDRVSAAKYANVYALYKDASGKAGPVVFGEYTAPVTTEAASNFSNPTQWAKSLFSYIGCKVILPRLVVAGRIKYAA